MTSKITLQNRPLNGTSIIGSVICRTPISPIIYEKDGSISNNRCVLIQTETDLIKTFGDPYLNPVEYSDLILARDIINADMPLYVASVYEMKDNKDGFNIPYNGYTEFTFKDKYKHTTITYKLKSNIKFCQPIIRSECRINTLYLYVDLYLLNNDLIKNKEDLDKLDGRQLYKSLQFIYDTKKATDVNIIADFKLNGLELQLINCAKPNSLINELAQYSKYKVSINNNVTDNYIYDLHTNDYQYDFSDDNTIYDAYVEAINSIKDQSPAPHFLCLGNLYRSHIVNSTYTTSSGDTSEFTSYAHMNTLEADNTLIIQNYLLDTFDSESDTYLFISTPDLSFSTVNDILSNANEFENSPVLHDQYNVDLYFGCAGFYEEDHLVYPRVQKIRFQAAMLTLYNMIINQSLYMANSIENLNISNENVKSIISEKAATILADKRCNSIVTFETDVPTTFGNRSLSTLPNLRYSNISRNFVYIRRLIREYLETRKFTINNMFNAQNCVNYINHYLLKPYKTSGILSDYSINFNIEYKTVYIKIELIFVNAVNSINLDFTI